MANGIIGEQDAQGVVIESQADWLTAGWDEGAGADRAEAWAFSAQQREARAGYRPIPFRLMGYEGSTVGRVRFGRRSEAALLQLSGALAETHLAKITEVADRISRIDLAVTIRLHRSDPFLGETTYSQASNHRAEHPKAAMPWIVQDGDGGCTAYVGHRASDHFFRVYNKEAESKAAGDLVQAAHYERCWRYELESKGGAALPLARSVVSAADRPSFVREYVYKYADAHGIYPAFSSHGGAMLIPGFRRRSDAESRLAWLRRSVNPAIISLLEVKDRADILDALGLGPTTPTE